MRLRTLEDIHRHYTHIYFSPHPDDAALSCGGRIASQARNGESVLVVTVFPPAGKTRRDLNDPALAVLLDCARRREEDDRAIDCLGADSLWLSYPDGIGRCLYPLLRYGLRLPRSEARLRQSVHDDSREIHRRARATRLYFPLGVGQHRDHQILFEVGRALCGEANGDTIVSFYEDVPYVFFPRLLSLRLSWAGLATNPPLPGLRREADRGSVGEVVKAYGILMSRPTLQVTNPLMKYALLLPLVCLLLCAVRFLRPLMALRSNDRVDEEIFDCSTTQGTKLDALVAYGSQVGAMFGSDRELRQALATYSRELGGAGECALERYWRMNGAGV